MCMHLCLVWPTPGCLKWKLETKKIRVFHKNHRTSGLQVKYHSLSGTQLWVVPSPFFLDYQWRQVSHWFLKGPPKDDLLISNSYCIHQSKIMVRLTSKGMDKYNPTMGLEGKKSERFPIIDDFAFSLFPSTYSPNYH